jgi:predicted glutamine amidotransferase
MCIIVYKRKGLTMPPMLLLENCFNNNPHGAGFMYRHDGKVYIRKGFMTLDALQAALIETSESGIHMKKTDLVIHFRISTTGSTIPQNCHPFPLSNHPRDLKALTFVADRAIAHNGILHEYARFHNKDTDMSDTMYFSKMLSGVNERFIPTIVERYATGSRFVYMSGSKIHCFGMTKIVAGEGKGLWVSNTTYQPPYVPKTYTYNSYAGNMGSLGQWATPASGASAGTKVNVYDKEDDYEARKEKQWLDWQEANRSRVQKTLAGGVEYEVVPGVVELPKQTSTSTDFKEAWDDVVHAELCGLPSEDVKAEDYFNSMLDKDEARKAIAKYYREKASGADSNTAFARGRQHAMAMQAYTKAVDETLPQKEIMSKEESEKRKKFLSYLNSEEYFAGM